MMTGRRPASGAGGSSAGPAHIPVLLDEVIDALAPAAGARIIDGTFGAGGYSRRLLASFQDLRVLAIERDPVARERGGELVAEMGGRLALAAGRFGDLDQIAQEHNFHPVDGVVLDIGVSSMQLDEPDRGFSFMADGPLDMRMEGAGESAADVVNGVSESTLADIIFALGEERQSRRIARQIARARAARPITTTGELARLVEQAIGRRPQDDRHPATRTFQALRMWVNDELGELARGLAAAERILIPGGRLVVVTFHSLEDRVVKRFLARRAGREAQGSRHAPPGLAAASRPPSFQLINHRPVTAGEAELAVNPRARSAKLRGAVRTDAPAWPAETGPELGLPSLPERS